MNKFTPLSIRIFVIFNVIVILSYVSGCPDAENPVVHDTTLREIQDEYELEDTHEMELDVEPDSEAEADEDEPEPDAPIDVGEGQLGSACVSAADCSAGDCLGFEQSMACAESCVGGCPAGTVCLPVSSDMDLCLPADVDTDADTLPNLDDNCPLTPNRLQSDLDEDGIGNVCDGDQDGDGASDDEDCVPTNGDIHPLAFEVCDGIDNNCDLVADDVSCNDDNPCTNDVCLGAEGCKHDPNSDPCSDSNSCTDNDRCSFGTCVGDFLDCDDDNPCTDDECDPTLGCRNSPNIRTCDDNKPCTFDDRCVDGECLGTPGLCDCETLADCDDDNPCTTDICDPVDGCVWIYNVNPCNDEDPCTLSDTCNGGVCRGSSINTCDDFNVCTTDTCDQIDGCVSTPNTNPCNDGSGCTIEDMCGASVCSGRPLDCDDDNDCTSDACDSDTGCVYTIISGPCDDGDGCTFDDRCDAGECVGERMECVDDNPCTLDTCDLENGTCLFEPLDGIVCDDGSSCTDNDRCVEGLCVGQVTADCCTSDFECDDSNPCTTDICDSQLGCSGYYNNDACNDGNPCTLSDVCDGGICRGNAINTCDDFNPCTTDSCNPEVGCVNSANQNPCNDHSACTVNDVCRDGSCNGTPLRCDDDNECTSDSCDQDTGCAYATVGGPCDDSDACTLGDMCVEGACVGQERHCDDENACTADSCDDDSGQCQYEPFSGWACDDGNNCTTGDHCVEGVCRGQASEGCCISDSDCDDGNPCTRNTCNVQNGQCSSSAEAMNDLGCNADNDGCTANDVCHDGVCRVGVPVDCSPHADDCNLSSCHSTGIQSYVCTPAPHLAGTPCEDGLYCTDGDQCDGAGTCLGGPLRDCSDQGGGCIAGTCDEQADRCSGDPLPNGSACNADNNGCSVGDTCQNGSCVAGPPADCSWQSSACIVGTCVPEGVENPNGYTCEASFKAQGTPCDDTLFCSVNDQCDGAGWCASGGVNPCREVANQCNTGFCDEASDTCRPEPVADGTICSDGDSCSLGDSCSAGACLGEENICGEYKVSTFDRSLAGYSPAIADKGAGEYVIFWQDDSGDHVNGRSYTGSWSKQWTEFGIDGADDDLDIDAAPMPDGGSALVRVHRVRSFSQARHTCRQYDSTCTNNQCGTTGTYGFHKYSGDKSIQERIYLTFLDADNQSPRNVLVAQHDNSTSWTYLCSSQSNFPYTANFDEVKISSAPSGNVFVMWQRGSNTYGKLYDPAGTQLRSFGAMGSSWSGFDIAAHSDDSFIVVWSSGGDLAGQIYTSTGETDGPVIVISNSSGSQEDPAVDTFTNGRFVVAWTSGDDTVVTRVFRKEGSPIGPAEVVANATLEGVSSPDIGAYDLTGNFIVVWQGEISIRAQLFDRNMNTVGDEKQVNIEADCSQPRVEILATDEGVVAWRASDGHIKARKYGPDGESLEHSAEIVHNQTAQLDQAEHAAVGLADRGYVVAWASNTNGNEIEIIARTFGLDGAATGDEFVVNATTDGWQTAPALGSDTQGDFVVVWESFAQDGDVEGVFGRLFSADGTPLSGEFAVNQTTDFEQFEPAVAVDRTSVSDGAFAVVWTSFENPGGSVYDVMARCFDASGNAIGNELMVNETTQDDQRMPAITYLPAGPSRYIVTWASKQEDGDNWGIFARRLSASCTVQGGAFQVNTTTADVQSQPAITAASDGSFAIVWRSLTSDRNFDIHAQRFDSSGNRVGDELRVNSIRANEQSSPTAAFLSDDTLLAGWMTLGEDEESAAVKFKRFTADFGAAETEFLGNIYYRDNQDNPSVTPLPGARYVIIWRSVGQDGDGGTIVGRVLP